MPTTEERVATLEEIARNHDQSINPLIQLAETGTNVSQQIVQTVSDLTTRFGHLEEAPRSVVTAVGALQLGIGSLQTEVQGCEPK